MSYIGNNPYQGTITGGNIVDGSIESIDLATLTNIDINSGSIDGTVIGASSPAAISGTTGQFSTSLNVDGTVTADGLTVDGGTTITKGSDADDVVTIAGSNTQGRLLLGTSGESSVIRAEGAGGSAGSLLIKTDEASTAYNRAFIAYNGDISFYDSTGTTAKFFWDASAESLGIGTTSPTDKLHVGTNSGSTQLKIQSGSSINNCILHTNGTTDSWRTGMNLVLTDGSYEFYDDVNNVDRMVITSSGSVGIGTSSPSVAAHAVGKVRAQKSGETAAYIQLSADELTSNYAADIFLNDTGLTFKHNSGSRGFVFDQNGTERARLDSSGNLLVGKTVADGGTDGFEARNGGYTYITANHINGALFVKERNTSNSGSRKVVVITGGTFNTDDNTSDLIEFRRGDGTAIGVVQRSGSNGVSYVTSSDYRLKENIESIDNASSRVLALKPCRFNFIDSPNRTVDGFLAHEAQEVVPEAVTGSKDGMRTEEYEVSPAVLDDEGNVVTEAVMGTREVPDYQGIDQSKLVPLLTKALQEALTEIESLKSRVAALENN